MGKRGPRATPKEILQLHGSSAQYKRPGEVAVVEGEPNKPSGLGEYGSSMWDRMIDRLRNQGILSPAWEESLTVLCASWQTFNDVWGAGVKGKELRESIASFWKCAADFGLTPAAKTGIRTEPKPAGKDKSRFVKGTG